jgi:hypothetical protein
MRYMWRPAAAPQLPYSCPTAAPQLPHSCPTAAPAHPPVVVVGMHAGQRQRLTGVHSQQARVWPGAGHQRRHQRVRGQLDVVHVHCLAAHLGRGRGGCRGGWRGRGHKDVQGAGQSPQRGALQHIIS